ncbi:MAG: hypothetical protein KatS3mg115_0542 [Candidatus Poribacteria bacterium]|nr:MAG: hypothetical protein KatS3mg115_0542 [Candidatus Poribacteria bacterium]
MFSRTEPLRRVVCQEGSSSRPGLRFRRWKRFGLPIALGLLLVPVGLAQAWLVQSRHAVAHEVRQLDAEIRRLENEIDALHLQAEALQSPARVRELARAGGYVVPEAAPVLVPPRQDRDLMAALEADQAATGEGSPQGPLSAGLLPSWGWRGEPQR